MRMPYKHLFSSTPNKARGLDTTYFRLSQTVHFTLFPIRPSQNSYFPPNISSKFLPVQDMKAYEGHIGCWKYSSSHS